MNTSTSRVPYRIAAGMAAVTLAAMGSGCSSKTDTPSASPTTTGPAATSAPSASGSPGSTAAKGATGATGATAAAGGDCPDKTELTIHTDTGDKKLVAKSAKAYVTFGPSATIAIGNLDFSDDQVTAISPPALSGDQLFVNFYVSATQGAKLEPATYTSVTEELGQHQLNSSEAYTADGRVTFTGFASVKDTAKLTKVDKTAKKICGTITTQLFDGSFSAEAISWSE